MKRGLALLLLLVMVAGAAVTKKKTTRKTSSTASSSGSTSAAGSSKESGWEFRLHVGLVQQDPVGMNVGLVATYHATRNFSWRTDATVQTNDLSDPNFDAVNIPSNIVWYPFGSGAVFAPYAGPGISYTWQSEESLLGYNLLAGTDFHIKGRTFGIEARYSVSDLKNSSFDAGTWELALTGSWQLDL